jgi:riboflavin kinase/FMN adenylyltransferase
MMRVYTDINSVPQFPKPVITIGSFDGLHIGHLFIIQQICEEAQRINGTSMVITFHPHPGMVLENREQPIRILTAIEEKINILDKAGVDVLVIAPFTDAFSKISADTYLKDFIIQIFQPHTIIIGHDHRFGTERAGGFELLQQYADNNYFRIIEIPEQLILDNRVSSTKIRNQLLNGMVEDAQLLLGRPYALSGIVVEGNQLGQQLGFPTANIRLEHTEKIIPADGVYIVKVVLENTKKANYGIMNIGIRPTIADQGARTLEVHLLDFDQMIYGKMMEVHFLTRIRDEKKFTDVEALKKQIKEDKETATLYLKQSGH